MIILNTKTYNEIIEDIRSNPYLLAMDMCKMLETKYANIPSDTIASIVLQEGKQQIKCHHHKILNNIKDVLADYEAAANHTKNHFELLRMSTEMQFSPVSLARLILNEKYKATHTKPERNEMLKNPSLIGDPVLSCNVINCILNDVLDGPLTYMVKRFVGEEYEIRLKQMSKAVGISYYDENDLRRIGFDKTPDLKLAVPCLYKGQVIHWIESKAMFGSMKTHQKYIHDQLGSYCNRFGAGIVIYWQGFLASVAECKENNNLIIVADSFPKREQLEFLTFE